MENPKHVRVAYLTFLECEVRDGWLDEQTTTRLQIGKRNETY